MSLSEFLCVSIFSPLLGSRNCMLAHRAQMGTVVRSEYLRITKGQSDLIIFGFYNFTIQQVLYFKGVFMFL